jgi:hypothetical protein
LYDHYITPLQYNLYNIYYIVKDYFNIRKVLILWQV